MKKLKFIIAVIVVLLLVLLIAYSVFTGEQLSELMPEVTQ